MKNRTLTIAACVLLASSSAAFAQFRPGSTSSSGMPSGLVSPDWKLKEHPQLEFAASSSEASRKQAIADQNRKKSFKTADPDDCNLQCPTE